MQFWSPGRQIQLLLLVLVLTSALALWLGRYQPQLALSRYDALSCPQPQQTQTQNSLFRVMVGTSYHAEALFRRLCAQSALLQTFGGIELSWPNRSHLTSADLLQGKYPLLWARSETLQALLIDYQQHYVPIIDLPDYPVFLYSKQPLPALSRQYLQEHQLGLLDDTRSYSGYQLPLAALTRLGMKSTELNIRFYPDWQSLAMAYQTNEISLISGVLYDATGSIVQHAEQHQDQPLYDVSRNQVTPAQRQLLTDKAPSGSWFLHRDYLPWRCLLTTALLDNPFPATVIGTPEPVCEH